MRKLLPYIVVILLLVAAVASVPYLLNSDRYRNDLANYLGERLHHKVLIGKLDCAVIPPTIVLHDVSLMNAAGDAPVLQMEKVSAPVDLSALLSAKLRPESIAATGWSASMKRNADGSWPWEEWLPPVSNLPQTAGWPLKNITLHQGEVHAIDPYTADASEIALHGAELSYGPTHGDLRLVGIFGLGQSSFNVNFQGSGHFLPIPQWTGTLQLLEGERRWDVDCKFSEGRLDVHGEAAEWRWDNVYPLIRFYTRWAPATQTTSSALTLKQWETHYTSVGSSVTFSHAAQSAGGQTEAKGGIRATSTGRVAVLDTAFKGVDVKIAEPALWGTHRWEGKATGIAHFQVALSSRPWESLDGQGYVEMNEGLYRCPDSLAKNLSKAHTMTYLQKKYPGFMATGLPFNKVAGHWTAKKGQLFIDDGHVDLGDVKFGIVGKIDAARHGLDAFIRMQIREKDAKLRKEISSLYLYNGQVQPINGHLQGTWTDWTVRAYRASKIPQLIQAKLRKALAAK